MSEAKAPLNGVRILDLTRVLSGPYCTLTLGDLGAEIIKIEEPTRGDDVRAMHISEQHGISSYFLGLNRNRDLEEDLFHMPDVQGFAGIRAWLSRLVQTAHEPTSTR